MKNVLILSLLLSSTAFASDKGNLIGNYNEDEKTVLVTDSDIYSKPTQIQKIISVIETSENYGRYFNQRYTKDSGIFCVDRSILGSCRFDLTKILSTYDKKAQLQNERAKIVSILTKKQKKKLKALGINL